MIVIIVDYAKMISDKRGGTPGLKMGHSVIFIIVLNQLSSKLPGSLTALSMASSQFTSYLHLI